MLILLSPSKGLLLCDKTTTKKTTPVFFKESNELIRFLKKLDSEALKNLYKSSEAIAMENLERFKNFKLRKSDKNHFNALYMFAGDVYRGLDALSMSKSEIAFSQKHLRILSGLYGYLKPCDMIQPYRFEMGNKFKTDHGTNLYHYWGDKITHEINRDLENQSDDIIINLASDEYFKSVKKKILKAKVIHFTFKEYKDGKLKFLSYYAKEARGKMARYIISEKINDLEKIKRFNIDKYKFNKDLSTDTNYTFVR